MINDLINLYMKLSTKQAIKTTQKRLKIRSACDVFGIRYKMSSLINVK